VARARRSEEERRAQDRVGRIVHAGAATLALDVPNGSDRLRGSRYCCARFVIPRTGTIVSLFYRFAGQRPFGGILENVVRAIERTHIREVEVGIYAEHVLLRIVNVVCAMKVAREQRQWVCEGLHGQVVEVGFGSGLNVPFYPDAVTSVAAIEPADVGWKLAGKRLASSDVPVQRSGLDGQALPLADDSCDTALTTWTLCTIPDVEAALLELRRVLKPGGTLHFVEHGLAPDERVQRWQHRLEPIQKRAFGGCHLTRPTVDLLRGRWIHDQ
jgi:SAM-dependent methyltransferase